MALEELLEEQIEQHGGAETVGLVFVERRITAMALHNYLQFRGKCLDRGNWKRAGDLRRRITPPAQEKDHGSPDAYNQFDDAMEEEYLDESLECNRRFSAINNQEQSWKNQVAGIADVNDQFHDADDDIEFSFCATRSVSTKRDTESKCDCNSCN